MVGVKPLQQYLVETTGGRLQALDVAWDTERKRWYHLYPDQDTSASNGMHWTGSYKNWNARCAECHATGYEKNYDPVKDSYNSRHAEIGVGCEACHGPAEAHVVWAKEPATFDKTSWQQVDQYGLTDIYQSKDATSEINSCAACHSRREPLGGNSPLPGSPFEDHYRLALLRDNLYFPDGQILDEVYVYGSFLQSKMYAKGVRCSNCHESHSYALKFDGNQLCVQCHNSKGNPAYPSLKKADYDTPKHHFHEPESEGSACSSCHMPERNYMVVDGRRDHSFRVPRPDLSVKLNTPNTCAKCHPEKDADWAAREIKNSFPKGFSGLAHYGEVFAKSSRSINQETAEELVNLAMDQSISAFVRASAIHQLVTRQIPIDKDLLLSLRSDKSAIVRMTATKLTKSGSEQINVDSLARLLSDPVQSVRIEAARAMLSVSQSEIPENARIPLAKAMKELQRSLYAKADFPESQMVLGGIALVQRNLSAATSAFKRAVDMDPQMVQAWLMLARIQAVEGKQSEVRATLSEALGYNPDNALLKLLQAEVQQQEMGK